MVHASNVNRSEAFLMQETPLQKLCDGVLRNFLILDSVFFINPFFLVQTAIADISTAIRDTTRAVTESITIFVHFFNRNIVFIAVHYSSSVALNTCRILGTLGVLHLEC